MLPCRLRPVVQRDKAFLFKLHNTPSIRAVSLHPEPIQWSEHEGWFTRLLHDPGMLGRIIEAEGNGPIGCLRLETEGRFILLSVAVSPVAQGQGVGSWAIAEGTRLRRTHYEPYILAAKILRSNLASKEAFRKAGWEMKESWQMGQASLEMWGPA